MSDWQIGSKDPPSVCLCCGEKFDESERKIMGPYLDSPYIWACENCHNKPFLHFPDKKVDTSYFDQRILEEFMK